MSSEIEKPDWWHKNEEIREKLDLPPYRPPQFLDGMYTHEVVDCLEQQYGVEILLVGKNTRYGEDWEITIDGKPSNPIGRHRDKNSNTVWELESDEFRAIVKDSL